jgi:hypothetical protein
MSLEMLTERVARLENSLRALHTTEERAALLAQIVKTMRRAVKPGFEDQRELDDLLKRLDELE